MKYQNTSRVLCVIFHALIIAVFGCLGCYFGFFVAPLYFTIYKTQFITLQGAFNLYLELAVIGLSLMTISIFGLVQGIKSVLNPSDDAPVVKSFTTFIVEGYLASLFFFANAFVFFDLAGKGGNLAFVIIMAVVFTIILLIATNIPMVRLYDGKKQGPLLASLSYGGAITFGILGLEAFFALLGSWSHNREAYSNVVNPSLGGLVIGSLVIGGLLLAGGLLISKKGEEKKMVTLAGYFTSGSMIILAALFLGAGIIDLTNTDLAIHLEGVDMVYTGVAYPIMCIVSGALLVIAGIAFAVINGKEPAPKKVASSQD